MLDYQLLILDATLQGMDGTSHVSHFSIFMQQWSARMESGVGGFLFSFDLLILL